MASREAITKVLIVLTAAYPRFEIPRGTASIYAELLHDVDDDLLIAAAKQHATNNKWFPTVAELRQAAYDIAARAKGIPSPAEAWAEVMAEVRRVGIAALLDIGPKVEFSTPLIEMAIEGLGGWSTVCISENQVADRAHFLQLYRDLLRRYEQDAAMLPEIRDLINTLSGQLDTPQLEDGDGRG